MLLFIVFILYPVLPFVYLRCVNAPSIALSETHHTGVISVFWVVMIRAHTGVLSVLKLIDWIRRAYDEFRRYARVRGRELTVTRTLARTRQSPNPRLLVVPDRSISLASTVAD